MSDVRCENVPDPTIVNPTDAIVRITSTAICGSDLHLYDGFNPFMEKGDILGHEPLGIVEEVGSEVRRIKRVESGEIDPSFVITHTVPIDKGPEMYKTFRDKEDGCIKVVLKPWN
jgi:threonine dehydrogenase-like Zn-dependent dehydrogenase